MIGAPLRNVVGRRSFSGRLAIVVLALAAAVLAPAAMGALAHAGDQDRVTRFSGPLVGETVTALIEALDETDAVTLVIRSPGGEELAAQRLGTYVHRHNINVVIQDYCISACFQYVALAARCVELDGPALIGVHPNAYGLSRFIVDSIDNPSGLRDIAARTDEFINDIGKPGLRSVLIDAIVATRSVCLFEREGGWAVHAEANLWIPDAAYLNARGFDLRGEVLADPGARAEIMARLYGPNRVYTDGGDAAALDAFRADAPRFIDYCEPRPASQ